MTESDFADYLAMKSDPDDVLWAGFAKPPAPEDFRAWFLKQLGNPERRMFMAHVGESAVGYLVLRGDEISYGVRRKFRGKGYAARMLVLAHEGVAWVAEDNALSVRALVAAGYRDTGDRREQKFALPTQHRKVMRKFAR